MKRNLKAAVLLLAVTVLAATASVGCSSSGSSNAPESSGAADTSAAADGSGGAVEQTEGSVASEETGTEDGNVNGTAAEAGAVNGDTQGDTDAGEYQGEVTLVKAVTTGHPSPYTTVNADNEICGSDIDILKAVFERLPQYELEITLSDDALTGIMSGIYDIGVNNYGYREERAESYYYSYPYKTGLDVYIQRADDEPLTGLKDLADRGYKTEVSAGSLKANALEAWNRENPDHPIEILYSDAAFALKFQHIIDGVTDVAIDDGPIFDTLIPEFGLEGQLVGNPIDDDTQTYISPMNNSYFLLSHDEHGAALREDINKAILEIYEDGTLEGILREYFGKDTRPEPEDYEEYLN